MRDHLAGKKSGRFMLKQDKGGITDIEFLAQYLVLGYSCEHPKLTRWSDNVRIFEMLAEQGILEESDALALNHAYTSMRDEIHHRNLLNQDADVEENRFLSERETVQTQWDKWMVNR